MDESGRRALRGKVLADPWYRKCWPDLHSFMSRSRQLRDRPLELLDLQFEMLSALSGAQKSKATLERELADHVGDESGDVEQLETGVAVARRLAHVIKQIADGIAWRALNYDRPVIRLLVSKPQTGHIDPDAAVQEANAAAAHVERTGDVVVVNDLTNFLRYGDYTCIGAESVTVVECKGGRAARRSGRARRQRHELETVLEFLNRGVRHGKDKSEVLLRQRVSANTHLAAVAELIREARKNGSAHERLSRCLAVDVLDPELLAEIGDDRRMAKLLHNPFHQTREAVRHHSLDFFGQFSPNLAPYSIYPFSDQDCSDVMTGAVWLISHFSDRNLARCLKRRGFSVLLPTEAEARDYLSLPTGDRRRAQDRVAMRIWRPDDPRGVLVGADITARMFAEFLDEESFADAMEEMFSRHDLLRRDDASVNVSAGFTNEAELWD